MMLRGPSKSVKLATVSAIPQMIVQGKAAVSAPQKPTIVLVGFTSLAVGSGTEQFLMNVARHAPTDTYRVVVVQTDFCPNRRWSDQYLADSMRNVEILSLRSSRGSLDPDRLLVLASRSLLMYLLVAMAQPFFRSSAERKTRARNAGVLRSIESADLIYLIRNDDRDWLDIDPSRTVLVGSTHCDDLSGGLLAFESLPGRRLLQAFYRRARRRSARQRGTIDAYHVTQAVYWRGRLKRTELDEFISLGVDSGRFTPRPQRNPGDPIRFLFVGGLESAKGLDRLLTAWSRVTSTRGELHVVGYGSLNGMVEEAAGRDSRIHYHGILEPDALTEMYRSCDIFVLPSRFETLGLVVLEALSSGLYVMASTAVRGVFDDFREQGALEYLDMSAPAFARRLQEISDGPPPLDDARRQSLHKVLEANYDWKRVSTDLFSWFGRLLERPPTPSSLGSSPP
jgi:glycosyltransferase involved in cell wall biosynthesis